MEQNKFDVELSVILANSSTNQYI